MIKQLAQRYEPGKSKKLKLIALCIKAVTGIVGGSLVLNNEHPYIALTVLAVGAIANEITNFISSEEQEKKENN